MLSVDDAHTCRCESMVFIWRVVLLLLLLIAFVLVDGFFSVGCWKEWMRDREPTRSVRGRLLRSMLRIWVGNGLLQLYKLLNALFSVVFFRPEFNPINSWCCLFLEFIWILDWRRCIVIVSRIQEGCLLHSFISQSAVSTLSKFQDFPASQNTPS